MQVQAALATNLRSEDGRVTPHFGAARGEESAMAEPHCERRVQTLHRAVERYGERLSLWFRRGFVVAIELRRKDKVTTVSSSFSEGQLVPRQLFYCRVQEQLFLLAIRNLLFFWHVELPSQRCLFRDGAKTIGLFLRRVNHGRGVGI